MNAQLPACKAGTLPLSYVPMCVWRVIERPFSVCRRGTALGPPSAAFPRPLSFFVRETAPLTSAGSDPATIALKARLIPGCQRSLPAVACFLVVCTGLRALRAAAIRAGRFPHGLSRFRLVGRTELHRPARGSCGPAPRLCAPCARLSGPSSVFPICQKGENNSGSAA